MLKSVSEHRATGRSPLPKDKIYLAYPPNFTFVSEQKLPEL